MILLKKIGMFLFLTIVSYSLIAKEVKTYIFINSDIVQHQSTINQLNNVLLKAEDLQERIYVIDISESKKEFRGEVTYIHDNTGYYLAELMPLQIPEVVETFSGDIIQHYSLDIYGLNLINVLITTYQENNNEK
ncbi:hypothetical protein ACU5DF_07795 [Aliivibrio wodanis]|uniref:hypothetical protein n=1 Tax=Aliivibrio wodanis TaxID=80852 RepID=UPI00406C1B3D